MQTSMSLRMTSTVINKLT